jgi:hypothetical protein
VAPFLGFLASRTVGVPQDPGDVGNWSDWVGLARLGPPADRGQRCAVSRLNHASHINSTLVTIAAGKAIWRCFHSAHAVTEKQPMSTASNPVQVSIHVPTT